MNDKTNSAFEAGANYSMNESFNLFAVICIAVAILLAAYITFCVLKGIGDESIELKDAPEIIIRAILIILVLSCFFYFQ